MWAGYLALVNQQSVANSGRPVGFINPTLYTIGLGSSYNNNFHDITSGSDGHSATTGYDLATGWGSPNGMGLVNSLAGVSSTPGFYLTLTPSAQQLLTGSKPTATYTVTVNTTGAFAGNVSLAVSGLPPGATASFNPPFVSGSGSSTMTLSVAAGTSTGAYTLTITGTSGSTSNSVDATLTIFTPASAVLVKYDTTTQGTWKGVYGSNGLDIANDVTGYPAYAQVALNGQSRDTWTSPTTDVRALQSGVTNGRIASTWFASGSFAIDVNLTDGNAHQVGTYMVDWDNVGRAQTISLTDAATGAVLDTRTITNFTNGEWLLWNVTGHVTFTITQTGNANAVVSGIFFDPALPLTPDFFISETPSSQTLGQSASINYTVTVSPEGGFAGAVAFSASGLPSGVTAAFNPTSIATSGSSILRVTTNNTVSPGTYPLTIKGAGNTVSHTVSATVVVTPPPPAETPTFSPTPGNYHSPQTVTIISGTPGASIRYTMDGSTPSETAGTLYGGPITVSATTTIKAIAYAAGFSDSAVVSATYGILPPLPGSWLDQDIGSVGVPGSASASGGVFTVQGAGNNIDDNTVSNDGYHFVYQTLTGDGTVIARVASMSGGKAGVMMRETLDPAATNAFSGIYQGNVWFFETRATAGATVSNPNAGGISVPYWFKVTRQSNNFSGYLSPDGVNWTQMGSTVSISMASTIYVGLAATSLSSSTLGTVTLDNVSAVDVAHDFQISAAPVPGSSSNYTVTVTAGSSFSGSIALNVSGMPAGATASFAPSSLSGSGTSTLTINTGGAAAGGNTLTVTGSSPNVNHSTTVRMPLPSPWQDQDMGTAPVAGTATVLSGVYTVRGSGNNIDDNTVSNDGYHFVYQTLTGDGSITARVASMSGGKAGVMMRETLDPAATNAFSGIYQGDVWFFETRATAGATVSNPNAGGISVPYWFKVTRQGNNFSGYLSPDGVNWTQMGSTVSINMAPTIYVGLVATSLSSTLGTVTFDNVALP